jgi:hypothetical protein
MNLLQENSSDNILYPTYLELLPLLFMAITSWGGQKQSYCLKEEGLKKKIENEDTAKKALTYMERHTSHIQILNFRK